MIYATYYILKLHAVIEKVIENSLKISIKYSPIPITFKNKTPIPELELVFQFQLHSTAFHLKSFLQCKECFVQLCFLIPTIFSIKNI